eukprot:symbB.v1.2.019566.t2/scaffold1591.1/size184449/2
MSFGEFQDLLESSKCYNSDFVPRRCGLAFRLAMMTQPEEVFRTRFQEMSFLEFQHAVGILTRLRSPSELLTADAVDNFILEKLAPLLRRPNSLCSLGGCSTVARSGKVNIAMTPTAFRGSMLTLRDS